MAVLAGLEVADPAGLWSELGFTVVADHCAVGQIDLSLGAPGRGLTGWSLAAAEADETEGELDGLPTTFVAEPAPVEGLEHDNGVVSLDHIVVSSPNLERTVAALGAHGILERRRRPAGRAGASPSVQVFFRLGQAVLELVGPADGAGPGPAQFWGLAFTVSDLDRTAAALGERLRPVKAAVQPGRFIASLDRAAGSTVEMAFMTVGP